MYYPILRFFKSIMVILSFFVLLSIFSIKAYDKGFFKFSALGHISTEKESRTALEPKTSINPVEQSAKKTNSIETFSITQTEFKKIDGIFSDFHFTDPITYFHKKDLYKLIRSKDFRHAKIDAWIEKALPEANDSEAETVYVRIVKLRQEMLQKK